ncbi:olfactory receptor 5AL1-like [Acomys russatus]|uniref:olfactory receptor 5AL1-like n=1 Tax=Acomys russatus TaxID=60746 RepID=UPI0021E2ACD5|nr:olfactory receptor 5AL1-like [Acomys russatus]
MAKGNHSTVAEFILLGLTEDPELEAILFVILLIIYLFTVMSNLGLVLLIQVSPQLQSPMYFFLSHLAFVDFCYTSCVTPNALVNFLREVKSISLYGCAAQVCFFTTFSVCEVFLLSVMAYDRYVAICNPLLYVVLMPRRLCFQIATITYVYALVTALVQTVTTFLLSFCDSNLVNQFFCEDIPLMALACSSTQVKELMLLSMAGFNVCCSLLIVLISYLFIVSAILRKHSGKGRQKVFSTCASHLSSIAIYYGTIIFMYLQPESSHSLNTDKFAAVFYVVVIPMLNPLIYSLRNKEVKNAFRRSIEKIPLNISK